MIRGFAARIALLNALLAVALFAIIGSIAAFLTYASVQNTLSNDLRETAREVPVVVGFYRLSTLSSAASRIIEQLARPGVRVFVDDDATQRTYDGANPSGVPDRLGPPPGGNLGLGFPGQNEAGPGDADGTGFDPGFGDAGPGGPSGGQSPPDQGGSGRSGAGTSPLGIGVPGTNIPPLQGSRSAIALLAVLHVGPIRVPVLGGTVVLAPDPDALGSIWQLFVFAMVIAGVLAAVASWAIGGVVSRASMRPLREVTAELERFGDGDFMPREVAALERGEFAGLAHAYNRAALQVARALDERRAAERDMRQFIADAAHELRTPLTIVTGYVELLRGGVDAARAEKIFATIGLEGERMRECIAKLLALARLDRTSGGQIERIDLSALAERVAETFATARAPGRITVTAEPGVDVFADLSELQDAIANLLDNAIKYGGAIRVEVAGDAEHAELVVADDGPGMTDVEAANAFARFYRGESRGEREGSGLGLAIVARIVERAGGTVTLVTAPGEGAVFTIRLDRAREPAPV